MILGLDVSTSIIGVCLLENNEIVKNLNTHCILIVIGLLSFRFKYN